MRNGIGFAAIFGTAGEAFGFGLVLQGDVVNLMPAVEMAQHFQRADLAALGGGMEEMRVHPEDFHGEVWMRRCAVLLFDNTAYLSIGGWRGGR